MFKVILSLFFVTSTFAVDMKPMGIEPGTWSSVSKMDSNGMMAQMLAKVPEAQRAMVKTMMEKSMKKQMQPTEACITKEMVKNPQKVLKEQMVKNANDCKFNVKESTSTKFSGSMECKSRKFTSDFIWNVINKKHTESVVHIDLGTGASQKISVTSKWVKSECAK